MGVTTDEINATYQNIDIHVVISGRHAAQATGVDVTMGLSQVNATATITGVDRPSGAEEGREVEVWIGLGGSPDLIFKGEVSGLTWRHYPGEVPVQARDVFARTRMAWGGEDREYTDQDDAAIIRNLLEAMGIGSDEANIESSGWTLGTVLPVVARAGQPFFSLIERIDRLAGYRTFTNRDGNILRRRVSGDVGAGSGWTYEEGVNIISCERQRRTEGIVNRAVVTGLTFEGLLIGGPGVAEAQADNPFIPDPPRYVTEELQDDLIEDDAKAREVAARIVGDKNRRPEVFRVTVPFNPRIQPLSIVKIIHDVLEVGSGSRFVVDQVQHHVTASPPTATTTFTTLGGNIVPTETNQPPLAAFDAKVFQESEDTGMAIESRIVVIADGSASSDPDGDTLTYAWTIAVDAGTVDPSSGTDPIIRAVISGAATSVTITLTVTDGGGATNVLTRTIPIVASSMPIEPLYLAVDGLLKASADGEATWNEFAVAAGPTCTPPFAAPWGTIFGASDGHIYITIDDLETDPIDTGAPHGAVACTAVWIHELDSTRGWAAFDDGKVYSGVIDSTTPAVVWTLAGTIPDGPVQEIREAVGALGSLRATAGAGYYASEDGGGTWTLLHTFDVAWRMAAGFDTNLASGLNSTPPLYAETGTLPTVPGGVTHIRGITFGWRVQALYATDDAANLYTTDSTFAALTAHTDVLPAQGNHMIRSGSIDGVIYAAVGDGTGDNGAVKWIPDVAAPWFVHRTGTDICYGIGYGPARLPVVLVDFVFAPFAESDPAKDTWHRYQDGVWSSGPLPESGWKWTSLKVHPANPLRWLLLGFPPSIGVATGDRGPHNVVSPTFDPLWISEDAGQTWTAITIPKPAGAVSMDDNYDLNALAWQEQSGTWALTGHSGMGAGVIWFGSGATSTGATYTSDYAHLTWVVGARNGQWITAQTDAPGSGTTGGVAIVEPSGGLSLGPFSLVAPFAQPFGPLDVANDSRGFIITGTFEGSTQGIFYGSNYADAPGVDPEVGATVDGIFRWTQLMSDGRVIVASDDNGDGAGYYVGDATALLTLLVGPPQHLTPKPYHVRVGRVTRRLAVGWGENGSGDWRFTAYNGVAFADIAMPIAGMQALSVLYDQPYDIIEQPGVPL